MHTHKTLPVLRHIFWRMHFWAGLISAPIVLFAAITGALYVMAQPIEEQLYAHLDKVKPEQHLTSLDDQIQTALKTAPNAKLKSVVPAYASGQSTQVFMQAEHAHHQPQNSGHDHGLPQGSIIYINPHTAELLGQLSEIERFKTWTKKLHSSALQGDAWRWVIELGASWMLVLFCTGLVMWWPAKLRDAIPSWGQGRRTWRDLHATVALALGLVLAVVLVTGLTWSRHSGATFKQLQTVLNQEAPKPPKSLRSNPSDAEPMSWQTLYTTAQSQAPDIAMQITPPHGPDGTWRIENFDRSQPTKRFNQIRDAYTGELLFNTAWSQLPALSKATAVGIPFHRGEFGLWNQILLILAALAATFSVVSGIAMWWLRRPKGQLSAPALQSAKVRQTPLWLWGLMLIMAWAMPPFGWSLLLMLSLESLMLWRNTTSLKKLNI